ncbi:MAG: hypothetical protein ACOVQX_07105 [Legionella sp.]
MPFPFLAVASYAGTFIGGWVVGLYWQDGDTLSQTDNQNQTDDNLNPNLVNRWNQQIDTLIVRLDNASATSTRMATTNQTLADELSTFKVGLHKYLKHLKSMNSHVSTNQKNLDGFHHKLSNMREEHVMYLSLIEAVLFNKQNELTRAENSIRSLKDIVSYLTQSIDVISLEVVNLKQVNVDQRQLLKQYTQENEQLKLRATALVERFKFFKSQTPLPALPALPANIAASSNSSNS